MDPVVPKYQPACKGCLEVKEGAGRWRVAGEDPE